MLRWRAVVGCVQMPRQQLLECIEHDPIIPLTIKLKGFNPVDLLILTLFIEPHHPVRWPPCLSVNPEAVILKKGRNPGA